MRGLDDHEDGLNDAAFDAAMERAATRGDALRDEQKGEAAIREHNKRQAIRVIAAPPTELTTLQRCLDLFNAALLADADVCLWENNTPGALEALTAWAAQRGHTVQTRPVDGSCCVHRVTPNGDTHADVRVYVRTDTP